MARYLLAIHRPNSYDPAAAEDAAMVRGIDGLNDEIVVAGVEVGRFH